MNKRGMALLLAVVVTLPMTAFPDQRIGVGVHYWKTVDSLQEGMDEDGVSWLVTYQRSMFPLLKAQVDLEVFPSTYAGSRKTVYAPQVIAVVGGVLYAGAGIGILYTDRRFARRPFYLVRAGLDIPILPSVRLDLNANYHFSEWDGVNRMARDVSSDTVTLGAAVRWSF